jgi:hypothetical protein
MEAPTMARLTFTAAFLVFLLLPSPSRSGDRREGEKQRDENKEGGKGSAWSGWAQDEKR